MVDKTVTEITLADLEGSTYVGEYAFYKMTKLKSIELPNDITSIGWYACYGCTSLLSITIPPRVETVGRASFGSCSSLRSVVISEGVEVIDTAAFLTCKSLKTVSLPNSLTDLKTEAFRDCSSISEITIPSKVGLISQYALYMGNESSPLTVTMLPTTPPYIYATTFNTTTINKIIVPAGCGDAYKTATNWSTFADYIEEASE